MKMCGFFEEAARVFKVRLGGFNNYQGLLSTETFFVRRKTQPVFLKLHPGAVIVSEISCV